MWLLPHPEPHLLLAFCRVPFFWSPGIRAEENLIVPQQITKRPSHHLFGYIGHCKTIPWNASERYILALRVPFQDHMPVPDEAAEVCLLDARADFQLRV